MNKNSKLDKSLKDMNRIANHKAQKEALAQKATLIKYTTKQFFDDAKNFATNHYETCKDFIIDNMEEYAFNKQYNARCTRIYGGYLTLAKELENIAGYHAITDEHQQQEVVCTSKYGPFIKTTFLNSDPSKQDNAEVAYVGIQKEKYGFCKFYYITMYAMDTTKKFSPSKTKIYSCEGFSVDPLSGKTQIIAQGIKDLSSFPLELTFQVLKREALNPTSAENKENQEQESEIIQFR